MVIKKNPQSLYALSLQSVCQALLLQFKNTYCTNYIGYSDAFINEMCSKMPSSFRDQIFDQMVYSQVKSMQTDYSLIPTITELIDSIIFPTIKKLNLHCLRHVGFLHDEELKCLEEVLVIKLPYLKELVEINLQTSWEEFGPTLPICTDNILKNIGSSCCMLNSLDVSHNLSVTDEGLQFLVPSRNNIGCPKLVKLSLFECSVTPRGVSLLLEGLHQLKFLGYRETVQSIRSFQNQMMKYNRDMSHCTLQLCHINNLGTFSRTYENLYKLECDNIILGLISRLCPKLNALKIRVNDSSLKVLSEITTVTILELVYDLGTPSSPGYNTLQYLQVWGSKFVRLSLVCDTLGIEFVKVICEELNSLKYLNLSTSKFYNDKPITMADKNKCVLRNLEEFQFKTGFGSRSLCSIPFDLFNYVLHKSHVLTYVGLIMRNSRLTDSYVEDLFSSIDTSKIKKVCIKMPYGKQDSFLTMKAVEVLMEICPVLEHLEKLSVWDISSEDIKEFRKHLEVTNCALIVN